MLAELRAKLVLALQHPVAFLLAVNLACAILGLAQFAFTLVVLKPVDFAVVGVLAAIGGVVTGLMDVKLVDLTTKLFYAVPKSDADQRAELIATSLLLHTAVGMASAVAIVFAGSLLAPNFVSSPLHFWWVAVMALRMGAIYPMAALTSTLRLLGVFQASGWLRLNSQIVVTLVTIGALWVRPDLTGYFAGVALGVALSFAMALAAVAPEVRNALGSSMLKIPAVRHFKSFMAEGSFLAGGSLSGLSKLLSRSCDILVVASVGNDTMTGLYRVARQLYDTIAGLSDAVHQFYTPTIVDCVTNVRDAEFRKHRRRLMLIGLAAAAATIAASWVVLRPLASAYYPHYGPALPAFEIFAGLLVVTLGVHGWMWPTLVASGRIWWFGVFGITGALVQLGTMALLAVTGHLTLPLAASTAWLMAGLNYGPFLIERVLRHMKRGR